MAGMSCDISLHSPSPSLTNASGCSFFMWTWRAPDLANSFPHSWQGSSFPPRCTLSKWVFLAPLDLKTFPQVSHVNSVWTYGKNLDLVKYLIIKLKKKTWKNSLFWELVAIFLTWDLKRSHGCVLCEPKDCCSWQKAFHNVRKDSSSIPSVPRCSGLLCIFSLWRLFHTHCKHNPWCPYGILSVCSWHLGRGSFYHKIHTASFEAQAGFFPLQWECRHWFCGSVCVWLTLLSRWIPYHINHTWKYSNQLSHQQLNH